VAESVLMEITLHNSRKIVDRYNTINVDDAKGAMERSKGYLNLNGSENASQRLSKKQKRARLYCLTLLNHWSGRLDSNQRLLRPVRSTLSREPTFKGLYERLGNVRVTDANMILGNRFFKRR